MRHFPYTNKTRMLDRFVVSFAALGVSHLLLVFAPNVRLRRQLKNSVIAEALLNSILEERLRLNFSLDDAWWWRSHLLVLSNLRVMEGELKIFVMMVSLIIG